MLSTNSSKQNAYNVNNYTDTELFNLLDLTNPSDKVLEAKILFMINKYRYINNEKGKQFTQFFKDIYERFFPDSDDDETTDEEDSKYGHIYRPPFSTQESFTTNPNIKNTQPTQPVQPAQRIEQDDDNDSSDEDENDSPTTSENFQENFTNPNEYLSQERSMTNIQRNTNAPSKSNNPYLNAGTSPSTNIQGYVPQPTDTKLYSKFNIDNNVNTFAQVDYKKDTLNPILKQTIKRIINIDSSKREITSYPTSTNYSFNLSEPLRDVLSIKMYSIHIPYSWYTVNQNFGGNFFYLKGNSPGINLGNVEYKVEIDSGNYTPSELVIALNRSLQALKTTYPDISFGTTSMEYNSNSIKTTINIDIKYLFNEKNFGFQFSNWSTPNNDTNRYNTTVAAYLGYNYQSYDMGDVFSYPALSLISSSQGESVLTQYNVSSTNSIVYLLEVSLSTITTNFINTIDNYIQQNQDSIIHTFDLSTVLEYGNTSRTVLQSTFSTLLASYNNSTITRIDVTDPNLYGSGNSYYKIHLNVYNNKNITSLKYILVFPQEAEASDINKTIWIGNGNSCFCFKKRVNILSDIIAETDSLQSNYVLPLSPYIELRCIADGYSSNPNFNNYTITIPPTTVQNPNYTFDQYIYVINNAIKGLSVLNSATSGAFSNAATSNLLKIQIDLVKTFSSVNYKAFFEEDGLFESIFISLFNMTPSANGTIPSGGRYESIISYRSTFSIPNNTTLFKIVPATDLDAGNEGVQPFVITTTTAFSGTRTQTQAYIQSLMRDFIDPITQTRPFSESTFSINFSGEDLLVELYLSISVTLTEKHYQIVFQDPNAGYTQGDITMTNWGKTNTWANTWYHDLKIPNQSYNLGDYSTESGYSIITATGAVSGYELFLDHPEKITFNAFATGVYSPDNANTISVSIPAGTYTRSQLLSGLNLLLANNPVTYGSSFFIVIDPLTNRQYVNFRMNINKMFTSNDFLLVFYDPFSFAQCISNREGGVRNAAWDSTIGWMIGFRENTEYDLSKYPSITNVKTLVGDSVTTTFMYNYFMLILDDFTQNHINDGLVSINTDEKSIPIIGGTHNNTRYTCDPVTGEQLYNPSPSDTQREIYAKSQILASNIKREKTYTSKPFIQNIFGIVPVKLAGLSSGNIYTEFGGTLQNQERVYFGPVNIFKMKIQLMNDRGEVVDLNKNDWSFSLICEQLYRQ
jgi:hypothetical protein